MPFRRRICVLVLALCSLPGLPGVTDARTWTDASGTRQTEAEMLDFAGTGEKIWLQTDAEGLLLVGVGEFSLADQAFVRRQIDPSRRAFPTSFPATADTGYRPGSLLCTFANRAVCESSGLAASRRTPGVFWTHNDSGDDACLYATDERGRDRGTFRLKGIDAFDWEDMAAFTLDGKPYLLVGDIGNNGRHCGVQMLHLLVEPIVAATPPVKPNDVPVVWTLNFAYEDDYHDCEALAVDPVDRVILLVTKEKKPECGVYQIPWPQRCDPRRLYVARKIATLKLPLVTGMDVSRDGCRAVLLTYGDAYLFQRQAGEPWTKCFTRAPRRIVLPPRQQGEAICFGADDKTLYLTSEGQSAPLYRVQPR